MRALQLIEPTRPLEQRDVPVPEPGAADALVRVKAAGVCHSDAHYRAGRSPAFPLPLTLGHEVAGVVESVGAAVENFKPGDRVCVHYLTSCGQCPECRSGTEQFCPTAAMIGKHRDGGFAEFIAIPARNLFRLPEEIPFEVGAIMMCSSATALHALKKARLKAGESVAIYGLGGLGVSAVQLARTFGAREVYGIDIKPAKLQLIQSFGVIGIDASRVDPVRELRRLTNGRGVDVALELIGLPLTMHQAVLSLAPQGRAALAGISDKPLEVNPYSEILNKEAEIIGVSDHLGQELPMLIEFVRQGKLNLSHVVSRVIGLEAAALNETLDELERFADTVRVVIVP